MATLFNTKISATYPGLIKTNDNTAITATLKQLTDGSGNNSGLYVNNAGDFKVTAILEWGSLKDTGTGVTITQWVTAANGIANFNNDTTVPTSAAVKTYVDAVVTASDLDFLGDTNTGTPAVDLDSQNFSVLGTTNEIVTSGAAQTLTIGLPNSVVISGTFTGTTFVGDLNGTINTDTRATTQSAGDNSTKVATTEYVDSLDAASDLDFSGDSGTGDVTLNTQVLAITGTTNQIVTAAANQGLSLSLPATVHRDLQGNVTGNVDGDLTGNVTATSVLADGVSATTQASSDISTKVATTAFVKGLNNASDLDFTTDSGSGAVVLNTETFSVLGTTNQINSAGSGQAITLSLPATVHRNLLGNVTGDLTGNADTATKWQTARDLSLTGQATGTISSVDGTLNVSGAVILDNNSVTGKVLTGLPTPASATVLATDSILDGIGKLQSQINGLANGLQFQGAWNATTNSPVLNSGGGEANSGTTTSTATNKLIETGQNFTSTVTVGDKVINQVDRQTALVTNIDSDTTLSIDADIMLTGEAYTIDNTPFISQGHYYVVSVGGPTSLNGINTWSVGDWVIAGATNVWEKLDHTDVEGTGTPGNIAKWSATGVIADSIMAESGSEITVTGTLSTTTNLNSGSNFAVATDKFTANATTGNVAFSGDLAINTNKFTVNATSGNTLVAGTLDVTSTANFASIIGVNGSTTANVPITATTSSGYEDVAYFKSAGTNIDSRISLFPTGTGDGVVNSTANNLILQTGGADRLTINSTTATFGGNVIVGTNITTTAGFLQLGAVALPSAGVAAITNRSGSNNLYIQTSSGNTVLLVDGAQNTMYSAGSTEHSFLISNVPKLTINSSGDSTFAGNVQAPSILANGFAEIRSDTASLYFENAANNDYYRLQRDASNNFKIDYYNGSTTSDRLVIDSSGNVGIGVSSVPSDHKLQIHNALTYSRFALSNSTSGSASGDGLKFQLENLNAIIKNQENGYLTFGTNGRETDLKIDSSGNVGIGGGTIEGKLSIDYTAAELPTSGTTSNSAIQVTSSLNNQLNLGLNTVSGSYGAYIQASDNNLAVPYPLNLQPNGGNVGIGTTSPQSKLHIQTDAAPTDIYLTDGTIGTDNYGGVVRGFSVAGQGGRLQLGTLDNDIYYPALTILQQGGNVGIGTDSPNAKLDILGLDLNIGADNGAPTTRTNSTVKVGAITSPHYTTTEENFTGMLLVGNTSVNEVAIGGGTSTYNSATQIKFYTGANSTTVLGTERMRITSGGDIQIPTNSAKIQLRGSGSSDYSSIYRDASNVIQIANTAGTNIVSIDNGGDVQITGTYPVFSVTGTGSVGSTFKILSSQDGIGRTIIGTAGQTRAMYFENDGKTVHTEQSYFDKGVYLGGSVAANLLDDYEEGTFTATTNNDGVGAQVTANYTKIGQLVTYTVYYPNHSPTAAGNAIIAGFPFTAITSNGYGVGNVTHSTAILNCSGGYNSTTNWVGTLNNSTSPATWVVASARSIMVTGFYYTTA